MRLFPVLGASVLLTVLVAGTTSVLAEPPGNPYFSGTWERTDLPVANGQATRTWMWGPEAITGILEEPYAESPDGRRSVQYFDKSRMEITQPGSDPASIWYVTNGLLVVEMVTGRNQVGDNSFVEKAAAQVNVAGDATDPDGPTYASFARVLSAAPRSVDPASIIDESIDRAGNVTASAQWRAYGVSVGYLDTVTNHAIAAPFWQFMNSSGIVYADGAYVVDALFQDPFFATGRPITEAYWATVQVGGQPADVLIQCFERRCLTFTPANAPEWQVESGNVGQHYYQWLYAAGEPVEGPCPDTTPGTYLYVADQFNDRIQKFDASFNFICQWGGGDFPPASFIRPIAVEVGADGFVYVLEASGIMQYNYRGGVEAYIELPDHSGLDFAIDSSGRFIVPSVIDSTIHVYDASGTLVDEWGSQGTGDGQFDQPWGVAVDADDRIYVVDHNNDRVQVFEPDGTFITKFGASGDASDNTRFSFPIGIDVDANRGVYVVDSGYVKMFGWQGGYVPTGIWGGGIASGYAGDGAIAVEDAGKSVAYVTDNANELVHRFGFENGANGAQDLGSVGGSGTAAGQFDNPVGIAIGTR